MAGHALLSPTRHAHTTAHPEQAHPGQCGQRHDTPCLTLTHTPCTHHSTSRAHPGQCGQRLVSPTTCLVLDSSCNNGPVLTNGCTGTWVGACPCVCGTAEEGWRCACGYAEGGCCGQALLEAALLPFNQRRHARALGAQCYGNAVLPGAGACDGANPLRG